MLLVLCDLDDASALSFACLARRAGAQCQILTTAELSYAQRFSHRLRDGRVDTRIQLADGTIIVDQQLTGVLNRTVEGPTAAWQRAAGDERAYASMELHACTLSWLHALPCPIRNRPTSDCLAGPACHPLVAVAAARMAGLPCPEVTFASGSPVGPGDALLYAAARSAGAGARPVHLVCLDGKLLAQGTLDVPDAVAASTALFARAIGAGSALIGLDFVIGSRGWWFAGVSPLPDLRSGGQKMVEALLGVLAPASPAGSVATGLPL